MKLLSALLIVSITLFTFFGVFVVNTKKGDRIANYLLGSFFMLWAIDFLNGLLILNGFFLRFPHLALWTEGFVFLYGPLLYFYSRRILKAPTISHLHKVFHLLPFLLILFLLLFTFHVLPSTQKIEVLNNILELEQPAIIYLMAVIACLHLSAYILLSKKQIAKADRKFKEHYSNYNFQWLKTILNLLLVILLISIVGNIFQLNQSNLYFKIALPLLVIVMTFFILKVFWNSLSESFIWLQEPPLPKYKGSNLASKEKELIVKELTKALQVDQLYLDPDLTLKGLAEIIGHNERMVSQVINEHMGQNFFNLVNGYRIEEAKKKLESSRESKQTISEILYEVGFNSKSSFNTQFKRSTGLTPSEYIKSI